MCDDCVATCRIVQGEEAIRQTSMASINATVQVPRLKMTRVHIPFTFRLLETGNNSYEGETRQFNFKTGSRMARDSLNEIPKSLFRVSAGEARVERQNKRKKKRQLDSRLKNNLVTNNHRLTYRSAESSINKRRGGRQTTFNAVLAAERRGWLPKSRRSSPSSRSRRLHRGRRHSCVDKPSATRSSVSCLAFICNPIEESDEKASSSGDSEKIFFSCTLIQTG